MFLEDFIITFGYLGIFLLILGLNVVPFFMPPTWIVLATIYFLYPQLFTPLLLALVGAFASTIGRAALARLGTAGRGLMSERRQKSMETVGKALRSKRYGGFILTFLYALTPLPSNAYFLTMGTMKLHHYSIYVGFWIGRLISYAVTVSLATVAFSSLTSVLENEIQAILLIDGLAILSMAIFTFIDWETLIRDRRVSFIKPRIW